MSRTFQPFLLNVRDWAHEVKDQAIAVKTGVQRRV